MGLTDRVKLSYRQVDHAVEALAASTIILHRDKTRGREKKRVLKKKLSGRANPTTSWEFEEMRREGRVGSLNIRDRPR
jgi:hypothetical protein